MNEPETVQGIKSRLEAFMKQPSGYKELVEFASKKFFRYFNSYSVTGITHEDIVSQVFEEIITGKRLWYPGKIHSFHSFLFLQVLSAVRNFGARYRLLNDINGPENVRGPAKELKYITAKQKSILKLISQLKNCLTKRRDFIAICVLASMTRNLLKPKQISEDTGISYNSVLNARKRIKNAARTIIKNTPS